jgi:hypothetical protein
MNRVDMNAGTAGGNSEQPAPPEEAPLTSGFKEASAEAALAASAQYQVVVYTGNVPYAGTDGNVWLWVDGTRGRSQWLYLDNPENNFEQNKTDYFYFTLPDLGDLVAAWIYFTPAGDNAAWFLATVTVNGKTFSYYDWLVSSGMVHLRS